MHLDQAIAAIASAQLALFTHGQLLATGLTNDTIDARVAAGWWERLERGLYRVAGAPRTWKQAVLAAVLAAGPRAAASHLSAAALWKLPGFPEDRVEVSTPYGCDHEFTLGTLHQSCFLPAEHMMVVDGIRVTRPARTVFDLAADTHPMRLERAANNALAMRLVTVPELRRVLDQLGKRGRSGTRAFRRLVEKLERASGHPESGLEGDLVAIVIEAGLSEPELQVDIGDDKGFIGRVDALWRRPKVIVEVDSDRYHSAPLDVEADQARDARLVAAGYQVLRFTETEIRNRPQQVAAILRRVLSSAA